MIQPFILLVCKGHLPFSAWKYQLAKASFILKGAHPSNNCVSQVKDCLCLKNNKTPSPICAKTYPHPSYTNSFSTDSHCEETLIGYKRALNTRKIRKRLDKGRFH